PVFEQFDFRKEKMSMKVVKDLALAPIEVGQTVRLNNVFFETGKAKLKPTSFPELNRVVDFMNEHPGIKLEIGGHTDNVGKPDKNLQLSRWRARACELYIESKGIQPDRITFQGYGMTKPVASNKTKEGKAQNRRVEFKILAK
ncbi:MAG: OmpA family protein, partial [Cytophagales bacterium]|nr:OmpA family protein [Cytophagales bacterium]